MSVHQHNKPSSSLINFYGCRRGHADTCLTAHSSLFHPCLISTWAYLCKWIAKIATEREREKMRKRERGMRERENMNNICKAATSIRSNSAALWHQNLTEVWDVAHFFRHSPSKNEREKSSNQSSILSSANQPPTLRARYSERSPLTAFAEYRIARLFSLLTLGQTFILSPPPPHTQVKELHLSVAR